MSSKRCMEQVDKFRGHVVFQIYPRVKTLLFQTNVSRIVVVKPVEPGPEQTVLGEMQDWDPEDLFEFHGTWIDHPTYGKQFKAIQCVKLIPTSLAGKERFLSRNVKGVGPTWAKRICEYFGDDIIDVLDNQPERLKEVPKIPKKLAEKVATIWHEEHDALLRQVGLWFAQFGVGDEWAKKFIKAFGKQVIEILTKNPYRAMKVDGIGFRKADDIARRMGWPECCPERTESAFRFVIQEALSQGHTFMHHGELIPKVRRVASSRQGEADEEQQLPTQEAEEALKRVLLRGELVQENVKIGGHPWIFYYLPHLYVAEKRLAARCADFQSFLHLEPKNVEEVVDRVQQDMKCELDTNQRQSVINACKNNIFILTGGPGTGKTTVVEAILKTAERLGLAVELAAPTGRAAKRMAEVTKREARTIHKLLEWSPEAGGFQRDRSNPIECDLLVVDEASMIDLELADALFDAVPDTCSIVLVGDIDQLPAVGPGMVLRDLIVSDRVAVTKLEKIFRQAEGSLIIRNAHKIRRGEVPIFSDVAKGKDIETDSYFMEMPRVNNDEGKSVDDIDWIKRMLPKVVERVKAKFGVDPIREIQVLCPMKKGKAGTPEFNKVLQAALNPHGEEITARAQVFRVGDRVMQLVNNYEPSMELSNGDIGFIRAFDIPNEEIIIDFYGRDVRYPFKQVDDIVLAYACTIHKSQGSEFPIVIVIMSSSYHWSMLERNLLYTANTRAKKMVVFMASWHAVKKAVESNNVNRRNTFLAHRIRKLMPVSGVAPNASAIVPGDWEAPCSLAS